jgi:predicted transcriptional regulator
MNEGDILQIVSDNPQISQRKIAEKTGISLGQVNFLMKKCVKKGLIKIEGQSPKSIRYNLTPKGMKEKAELTLQYIKLSYKAIINLSDKIREITDRQIKEGNIIYVLGKDDEIMELVKIILKEKKAEHKVINNTVEIDLEKDYVIYFWEHKFLGELSDMNYINVLE